jgi:hypothetical protein
MTLIMVTAGQGLTPMMAPVDCHFFLLQTLWLQPTGTPGPFICHGLTFLILD